MSLKEHQRNLYLYMQSRRMFTEPLATIRALFSVIMIELVARPSKERRSSRRLHSSRIRWCRAATGGSGSEPLSRGVYELEQLLLKQG